MGLDATLTPALLKRGRVFRFDFYRKFSAKVSEYFTRPPPGAGTLYSILAGGIEIFLQSRERTNSDTADIPSIK